MQALSLQGFDFSIQHLYLFSNSQTLECAGNAFNGFCVLAVIASSFAFYDWELGLNVRGQEDASMSGDGNADIDRHSSEGPEESEGEGESDLWGSDLSCKG